MPATARALAVLAWARVAAGTITALCAAALLIRNL